MTTPRGTVVATWGADRLVSRRSTDGGATWEPEVAIGPGLQAGGTLVDEASGDLLAWAHPEHPPNDTPHSFADSIAFTDWFMDSHSCDHDFTSGDPVSDEYPWDCKLVLADQLRPAQIPYRSLLPRGLDNLVVPVAMACTHIAHGAVRLEPCWTHLGEVAGFAAAMAHHDGTTAGQLDGEHVAEHIAARGVQVVYPKPDAGPTVG